MSAWYDRTDASDWAVEEIETSGSSPAHWRRDPGSGERWLVKGAERQAVGGYQGEDWAEVIASQVAERLAVPHADARLLWIGEDARTPASGSRQLSLAGHDFNEGWLFLEAQIGGYAAPTLALGTQAQQQERKRRAGYSLENIQCVLERVAAPPEVARDGIDAFGTFCGYLMLDALVANRDRHDQNWAVFNPRTRSASAMLAPSYDHSSALGFSVHDGKRQHLLARDPQLDRFARRATANRFERPAVGPLMTLVDLMRRGLELSGRRATSHWAECFHGFAWNDRAQELRDGVIPELTGVGAIFVGTLIETNRRRVHHAFRHLGACGCRTCL